MGFVIIVYDDSCASYSLICSSSQLFSYDVHRHGGGATCHSHEIHQ